MAYEEASRMTVSDLMEAQARRHEGGEGSKSLARALQLLACFTESTPEWGVSELSRHTGIGKSTISTALATLADFGLVHQNRASRRYQLGLACLELAYVASSRLTLRDYAFPYLEELRGEREWIIYLAIPQNFRILYVEALYPPRRRINYSAQGRLLPMYCTGIGKAALAWMPDDFIERYLAEVQLATCTPNTLTSAADLQAELLATRERGYAVDRQENERGIQCVAAPVLHRDGRLIAAISVSGSEHEVPEQKFAEIAREVVAAANGISRKLNAQD
jgi:IclR family KDG regulon transcriptional repressor